MRFIFVIAAASALAACTSAKEQAETECAEQSGPLGDNAAEFCSCLTKDIPEDASTSEAEEMLEANAPKCTSQILGNVMEDAMKDLEAGADKAISEAEAAQ